MTSRQPKEAARVCLLVVALCASSAAARAQESYRRPVACSSCIANWYYFDENPAAGARDWSCASSSYDGHRGSDFSLAGGNGAIAGGHDVVAAARGTVVSTMDGFFDLCTSCPAAGSHPSCGLGFGSGFGNHVVIQHGTERVVYAHMRTGSIRVSVGETVTCGQVIGQIGSSGCSTGAHFHFEPRSGTSGSTAFDPFEGACSPTTPSRWTSQGPHRGLPGPDCPVCPVGSTATWTCSGSVRSRCIDGATSTEDCAPGSCEARPAGTDHVCDRDGDGYATDEGDCDDARAAVSPSGVEVCSNGLDDDCAGGDATCPPDAGTDAGPDAWSAPDASGCPPDLDDRWRCEDVMKRSRCVAGLTETDVCAPGLCEARMVGDDVCDRDGDGFAADEGDCMDLLSAVHPGAAEICSNMIDDDCSGGDESCAPDAGPPSLDAASADAGPCLGSWDAHWTCDGDRLRRCVGVTALHESCAPGVCEDRAPEVDAACDRDSDGYATDEGDCNDRDARVHPGASEVCGNALDDDCIGGDARCERDASSPDAVSITPDSSVTPALDASADDAAPAHDSGARATDGGLDAGSSLDASVERDGGPPTTTAGCGCRAAGASSPSRMMPFLLAALCAGASRRRRTQDGSARRKLGAPIRDP